MNTAHEVNIENYKNRRNYDNNDCRFNVENITPDLSQRIIGCHAKYGQGIAILGDSHAIDLFGTVAKNSSARFVVGLTKIGCDLPSPAKGCQYSAFLNFTERNPEIFSHVIFEAAGYKLLKTATSNSVSPQALSNIPLTDPITEVFVNKQAISGVYDYLLDIGRYVPVLWFGPRVEPHIGFKTILEFGCDYEYALRPNQFEIFHALDNDISKITSSASSVEFLSQNEAYNISFPNDFLNCSNTYWADGNHLSEYGERVFGERFDVINYALGLENN